MRHSFFAPYKGSCGLFKKKRLSRVLLQLRVVRNFWVKSDAKGAVEAVAKMGDNAVLVDVMRVLLNKKDSLSTEVCTALFPLLKELLSSQCAFLVLSLCHRRLTSFHPDMKTTSQRV